MGMFSKKKEQEFEKAGPAIDTMPMPNIINADMETQRETRQIVVKDVSKEFEAFRDEIAQTYATQEDTATEIMKLHEKLDHVIAYLKSKEQQQQRPTL